ncbi:MAG: hypothetical protein QW587_04690 [Candidatus Bathyarchaeia archaeon]
MAWEVSSGQTESGQDRPDEPESGQDRPAEDAAPSLERGQEVGKFDEGGQERQTPLDDELVEEALSYFSRGYKPARKKRQDGVPFIILRLGNKTQTWLCPYTPELWRKVSQLYDEWRMKQSLPPSRGNPARDRVSGLLTAELAPPEAVARRIGLSTTTLDWYEWAGGEERGGGGGSWRLSQPVCSGLFHVARLILSRGGEEG